MARAPSWIDAARDQWDSAPDVTVLWSKSPIARKAHRCNRCGEEIQAGQRYESLGVITGGEFQYEKLHRWANQYPSGCPRFRELDMIELEKERIEFASPTSEITRLSTKD